MSVMKMIMKKSLSHIKYYVFKSLGDVEVEVEVSVAIANSTDLILKI
jgi:hypothetical protein